MKRRANRRVLLTVCIVLLLLLAAGVTVYLNYASLLQFADASADSFSHFSRSIEPSLKLLVNNLWVQAIAILLPLLTLFAAFGREIYRAVRSTLSRLLRFLFAEKHVETVATRPFRRVDTPADLAHAANQWDEHFLESSPVPKGLKDVGWSSFRAQFFGCFQEPTFFEQPLDLYVITGPIASGKSLHLLHSLHHWLEQNNVSLWEKLTRWYSKDVRQRHSKSVLLLNHEAPLAGSDAWGTALENEQLQECILVLDGVWRVTDRGPDMFRERLTNLLSTVNALNEDADHDVRRCKAVVTMRNEDFRSLQSNPIPNWPSNHRIHRTEMRLLSSGDPRTGEMVKRYVGAFRVTLSGDQDDAASAERFAEWSGGNPGLIAEKIAQCRGSTLDLTRLGTPPLDFLIARIEGIASRFWVQEGPSNRATLWALCLLATQRLQVTHQFISVGWRELGANPNDLHRFLATLELQHQDDHLLLGGHDKAAISRILNQDDRGSLQSGPLPIELADYYHNSTYQSDCRSIGEKILEDVTSSPTAAGLVLLGDVAALGEPYLTRASDFVDSSKEQISRERTGTRKHLYPRLYDAWCNYARALRAGTHGFVKNSQQAAVAFKRGFEYFDFDGGEVDISSHRLHVHSYVSLTRRFVLPAIEDPGERRDLISECEQNLELVLEIEKKLGKVTTATLNEHAQFTRDVSDYPYAKAEQLFESSLTALQPSNSPIDTHQKCYVQQAFARFLHDRSKEDWEYGDVEAAQRDKSRCDLLFQQVGDELQQAREQGMLTGKLRGLDRAHLDAWALVHRERGAMAARERRFEEAKKHNQKAMSLIECCVQRYPYAPRAHNAIATSLRRAGKFLPEYREIWFQRAQEHLEKAIEISRSRDNYFQASVALVELGVLLGLLHRKPRPYALITKRLENAVDNWTLPSRQASQMHHILAQIYLERFRESARDGYRTRERTDEFLDCAGNHLGRAERYISQEHDLDHVVRLYCTKARYKQLAMSQEAALSELEVGLELARSRAPSLGRAIKVLCEVGEDFLEDTSAAAESVELAATLFASCLDYSRQTSLPETATFRAQASLARAYHRLGRYEDLLATAWNGATLQDSAKSYGSYRRLLHDALNSIDNSRTLTTKTKGTIKHKYLETMLALSQRAFERVESNRNAYDFAQDLQRVASATAEVDRHDELLQKAQHVASKALDLLSQESHHEESEALRYGASTHRLLATIHGDRFDKDGAKRHWEMAAQLDSSPVTRMAFSDFLNVDCSEVRAAVDQWRRSILDYAPSNLIERDRVAEWVLEHLDSVRELGLSSLSIGDVHNGSDLLAIGTFLLKNPEPTLHEWLSGTAIKYQLPDLHWFAAIAAVRWSTSNGGASDGWIKFLKESCTSSGNHAVQSLLEADENDVRVEAEIIDQNLRNKGSQLPPRNMAELAIQREVCGFRVGLDSSDAFKILATTLRNSVSQSFEQGSSVLLCDLFVVDALRRYGEMEVAKTLVSDRVHALDCPKGYYQKLYELLAGLLAYPSSGSRNDA